MATIDDKVVAMSFESSKFESGVNKTLSSLDKLKAALHFPNAGKGFQDIDAAAKRVNLNHISEGVDGVKRKLESLRLVAIGVMSQLTTQFLRAGASLIKSFTFEPLQAGFQEYATNLNAVQTILANTQAAGVGIKEVNATLRELNEYSDKTIYNFSQMARNIGTFTAAGVDLDTATGSIKGIANLAALSGSNAEQAATAMYQLSQAISAGAVKLMDWNSVVNAGMGGTVFQRALAQTAESMGKLKKGTVELVGPMKNVKIAGESFRQSLSKPGKDSWLTSDVLTRTLEQFTGDLSDAELKAQGFNDAQIKAIQQTAKTAMLAATEVKTMSQVLQVAKETAGSGWAQTWQLIFGDFEEAKETFTAVSNAINGFINRSAEARNKVLSDWKELGGRTLLIDSIRTAFQNLGKILAPIKQAFRDIFPAKTGSDLMYLTQRFNDFTHSLKPSKETIEGLRRTFAGIFALFSIGMQIVKGIFTVFGQLFGAVGEGSGSFLNITGSIGDFLVSLDKALKKGDRLHNFFEGIGRALRAPIELLGKMAEALGNLFGGFSSGGFSEQIDGITIAMTPFEKVINAVSKAWDSFINSFEGSGDIFRDVGEAVAEGLAAFSTAFGQAASSMNFEAIFAAIRTGLFAGLVLMFKNFLGKGSLAEQLGGAGGGILQNISGSFDALRGSMVAMQQNIKADTLKKIAIAVALLAASVVALSFVDPERLKSSLAAMTVAFGQLLGAMAILGNISKSMGFIKMPVIAASMILLAGAITILSAAVVILAQLSWSELARGLGGVVVLLGAISVAVIPLSNNSAGMIRAGIGITAIAVAMNLLALAVRQMASMSWTELGKGLGAAAVGLGIMVAAMTKMPAAGMVRASIGINAIAVALNLLALAVRQFASMSLRELGKGLGAVAVSLGTILLAMKYMPKNMTAQAAGLILIAGALNLIALAIKTMGGMSIEQMAKGLGTLAGALLILGVAMKFIAGSVRGAVALGMIAASMALLAPALVLLGKQSWEEIIKSLVTLAAALTVLGLAGLVLAPVVPALLGLGAALLLIGGGLALAGAGVALIGVGLSSIAVAGPMAVGILTGALIELSEAIPEFSKNVVLGLLEMAKAFANTAPQFVEALAKILNSLLEVIIQSAPKIGEAISVLLATMLQVLQDNQGKIIQAGLDLIIALLKGIRDNIREVVTVAVDVIVNFLKAISNNLNRIIAAGANVLVSFLKGIANNLSNIVGAVGDIITRFISAISNNLGRIATAGLSILTRLLKAIGDNIGRVITAGTDIVVGVITGIGNAGARIVTAAVQAIVKFVTALGTQAPKLADAGFKAIIAFMDGISTAIDNNSREMGAAGARLGLAIVKGMITGLAGAAGELYGKAREIAGKALSILKAPWKVLSPSRVMFDLGENIILGMSRGLDATAPQVYSAAEGLSNGLINKFNDVFQTASPSKVMHEIGQFVGQGFANGLRSSGEDINRAFSELDSKLTDAMVKARETIASEQEKLDKLREAKKPDAKAIAEAQKVIKENELLLARSTAGHIALTKSLRDEKAELVGLAGDYERIGERLKKAQDVLAEAQKTRADAIKGFTDQYSTLPEIVKEDAEGNAVDQLATYMEALKHQADAVGAYQSTLDQLRKLGLDDATYQKLLKEGTANQQFANQLLSGGKTAVQALNTLDSNLMKVSKTLAVNAGNNLYQAGVDAAEGLVKGLKSKQSAIRKEMEEIAREMVRALKKELKIKSPSEVFAEIGAYSMQGMAKGFADSSKVVVDAVDQAAKDALSAMKSSMSRITDAVTDEINPSPVITPVLDLTQIRTQSSELAALTNMVPITAAASFGQASIISSQRNVAEQEEATIALGGPSVKFEQNNYSPEALSEVEIYRQTRNQLSQFKSILAGT